MSPSSMHHTSLSFHGAAVFPFPKYSNRWSPDRFPLKSLVFLTITSALPAPRFFIDPQLPTLSVKESRYA